jgi:hypothetical protein
MSSGQTKRKSKMKTTGEKKRRICVSDQRAPKKNEKKKNKKPSSVRISLKKAYFQLAWVP